MDMAKIFGSAEAVSSSAKPSPAPAAPAAAGDGKKAWHFIRQVTSVTRVSHETLEADPKFETFDAFLRKRQRLGRVGTNFQDSLLAEIAYVFFSQFVNMYRPETD